MSSKPPVTFHVNSNLLKILRRRWRFLFLVAAMYVEAWQVRATAILVTAMVLVFGYYFLALVLLVVALAATITQIEPGNAKPPCEGPPADAVMEV